MKSASVRVWDLPVRVFHWLWAGCFAAAFVTHESDRWLDVHVFAGYAFFALLIFRLLWGLTGSEYARFRSFAFSPAKVLDYLTTLWGPARQHYLGHNPAGSWAIFALLLLGFMLSLSGVFTLGMEEGHGPLAALFNPESGETWKELHETLAFVMLGLIGAHIAGVFAESLLHRENLARAMMTGDKPARGGAQGINKNHTWLGLSMLAAFIAGLGGYFQGYVLEADYRPFIGPQLADNPSWRDECGSCHVAYHPSLLPARSWQAVLDGQAQHFGDDLALDEDTLAELRAFHTAHAADQRATEAAYKILRSIAAGEAPLRITESGYWTRKHEDIADRVWHTEAVRSRANCNACHRDAQQGTYEDAAMHIPQ